MGKVALDDELFIEYFRFKNGKTTDHSLVCNLLSHLKLPFVQSSCQAYRCHQALKGLEGDEGQIISPALLSAFLSGGIQTKTIEELGKMSRYHLVLTADDNRNSYPYLNINERNIELNYSKTCLKGEPRSEITNHLESLCTDATKITICDNYFFAQKWGTVALLLKIFLMRSSLRKTLLLSLLVRVNPLKNTNL